MKQLVFGLSLLLIFVLGQPAHTPPPESSQWQYGVTAHLARRRADEFLTLDDVRRACQQMRRAGIQVVRLDFEWEDINPAPDTWTFDRYDETVRIVRGCGLDILGIIGYSSWWASSLPDESYWLVRMHAPPANLNDYAHLVNALVQHYQDEITAWEIGNEPNTILFWHPKPDPARYIALLRTAYLAAKAANRKATVVFGGLSGNGIDDGFLEAAYAAGARGYFDVMAIHPYVLPGASIAELREKILATRALMEAHGDRATPIWLTEIGVPDRASWWQGAPVQSEADVARWLHLVFTQLWDLTPTIFWYEIKDEPGHMPEPESHFGLVRADSSLKPAYWELYALTH